MLNKHGKLEPLALQFASPPRKNTTCLLLFRAVAHTVLEAIAVQTASMSSRLCKAHRTTLRKSRRGRTSLAWRIGGRRRMSLVLHQAQGRQKGLESETRC